MVSRIWDNYSLVYDFATSRSAFTHQLLTDTFICQTLADLKGS